MLFFNRNIKSLTHNIILDRVQRLNIFAARFVIVAVLHFAAQHPSHVYVAEYLPLNRHCRLGQYKHKGTAAPLKPPQAETHFFVQKMREKQASISQLYKNSSASTSESGLHPSLPNATIHSSHWTEQAEYKFPNIGELSIPSVNPITVQVSFPSNLSNNSST